MAHGRPTRVFSYLIGHDKFCLEIFFPCTYPLTPFVDRIEQTFVLRFIPHASAAFGACVSDTLQIAHLGVRD